MLSSSTFSDLGGAASDLFAGFAATSKADLTAQGLNITAQGTRISADGTRIQADGTRITANGTRINAAGTQITAQSTRDQAESTRIGAAGVRLNADSLRTKAQGDEAEASNYDLASGLALENEGYTEQSTRIQQAQQDRSITQTIGGQRASVAAAGFTSGGSAGDLLRDSASQGALAKGVLAQQGAITEAGYNEQALSYQTLASSARTTAAGEIDVANKTDVIADRTDAIAANQDNIATQQDQLAGQEYGIADSQDVIAGKQDAMATGEDSIATQQDQLAAATKAAGQQQQTGDFISSAIKGVAAVAGLALAPATGGASLAISAAANSAIGDANGIGGLY